MESMQNLFEILYELYDKPPLLDEMNQILNAIEKDKAEALNISAVINSVCPRCDCETKGYVSNKVRYWYCENCGVSGQTDL